MRGGDLTLSIVLRIDDRERFLGPADLPLAVGGPEPEIAIPGIEADEPLAHLGLSEGQLFVQAEGGAPVLCNGAPVTTSQWLYHGDILRIGAGRIAVSFEGERIRLELQAPPEDDLTAPPTVTPVTPAPPPTAGGEPARVKPVAFQPGGLRRAERTRRRIRLAVLVAWAPLVALGLVAWYMLTARSVLIVVEPEPDLMTLEGGLSRYAPAVGGRRLLQPGSYALVAEKTGHRRLEITVEVSREADQTFRFELRRLPDLLAVDTGAVEGAVVLADGERRGETPLAPFALEPGEHELRVLAERYEEFATGVTIEGGGETRTLVVELVPRWAEVTLSSSPAGASILADGERVGVTPATVELLEGRHVLELRLSGHKPYRRSLEVVANEPQTLPRISLTLVDGRLGIRSEPSAATVTVDGTYRGQTPLDLHLPPGGPYEIDLSKAGHEPETREVSLQAGRTTELSVALTPSLGQVQVTATPEDAELLVDGQPRGQANQLLELVAVPHRIEVRREGYEPFRTTVTPRPGYPQSIEVVLKTAEQIRAEKTPPVIRSSEGQEMVLVEGGRFRMGAPRREPGRRSNEIERDVELVRPFYIATKEVSNREFRRFQPRHDSGIVEGYSLDGDDHPVVRVTWEDAALYCNWLSKQESLPPVYETSAGRVVAIHPLATGYRLPTEAEWAWAARFAGDDEARKYVWGDTLPVASEAANFADLSAGDLAEGTVPGYNDHFPATAPVGSFPPNPMGLFNLGGNVAEWVHDVYSVDRLAPGEVDRDPVGPLDGDHHVIRGSSWMDYSVSELRLTYRDHGARPRPDLGFRVARYAE
jgi:formylglycine-generating enzyme required for sulfatase activity